MKYVYLALIFLSIHYVSLQADDVDQALVDYYLESIKNLTESAQNYVLPTNARMYEPENKTIQGMM